jgi:hypothetical protein
MKTLHHFWDGIWDNCDALGMGQFADNQGKAGNLMPEEWEHVGVLRHKQCGNLVYVAAGTTPHCPVCERGSATRALCGAAIMRVMRARRRITVRELKQWTTARRFGAGTWDAGFAALVGAGAIRVEQGRSYRSCIATFLGEGGESRGVKESRVPLRLLYMARFINVYVYVYINLSLMYLTYRKGHGDS